jgi:translation initiation factor 3 subunit J
MADSWEEWDDDAAAPGAAAPAAPAATFEGEDAEEEEPRWKAALPKTQEKKRVESKYDEARGRKAPVDDEPLDDPLAERLRRQRLVEEADFEAAMELFSDGRSLEGFAPKTPAEFEDFGQLVAVKHLLPLARGGAPPPAFKGALKALLRVAMHSLPAADIRELETFVGAARAERIKEEKAAAGGKKALKKGRLNVGRSGGAAGLDDFVYDDPLDDEVDFM